jgi:hypothetical protein
MKNTQRFVAPLNAPPDATAIFAVHTKPELKLYPRNLGLYAPLSEREMRVSTFLTPTLTTTDDTSSGCEKSSLTYQAGHCN